MAGADEEDGDEEDEDEEDEDDELDHDLDWIGLLRCYRTQ